MARVNQGKYKEIIKNYKKTKEEYNELVSNYYAYVDREGGKIITQWDNWIGNEPWDLFDDTSSLWVETVGLINEIENLLTSQKFESENKKEKYKERILILKEIESNLIQLFKEIYDSMKFGLSEKEQEWLLYNELYKRKIQ